MLVLKHGLEVDMDSVVMICWIAFAIMTTMIERYLGLKRWLVTTYRRFKPTHDARSPWRVVNERLPSPDFTPLLVFVNSSSGGNLGKVLLEHVEELNLNELQVWNMYVVCSINLSLSLSLSFFNTKRVQVLGRSDLRVPTV